MEIDFYKGMYLNEFDRKNIIDSYISYPTTLLTLIISAELYFIEKMNFKEFWSYSLFFLIVYILISLLLASTIFTSIYYFVITFLNSFKKYKYLPSPANLKNRQTELFDHYYTHFKNNQNKKPKKKARQLSDLEFKRDMINYYVDYGTQNQMLNDKRKTAYYLGRRYLVIALLSVIFIGLLTITNNKYVKSKANTATSTAAR